MKKELKWTCFVRQCCCHISIGHVQRLDSPVLLFFVCEKDVAPMFPVQVTRSRIIVREILTCHFEIIVTSEDFTTQSLLQKRSKLQEERDDFTQLTKQEQGILDLMSACRGSIMVDC